MTTELCFLAFVIINNRWKTLTKTQCICCTTWGESLKALEFGIWTVTEAYSCRWRWITPITLKLNFCLKLKSLIWRKCLQIFTNLSFLCLEAWTASATLSLGSGFSTSDHYPCCRSSAHLCCFMIQTCSLNQLGLKVISEVFFLMLGLSTWQVVL